MTTIPHGAAHDPPRDPRQDPFPSTPAPASYDPVRFCVLTTVAVIAWIAGPPFAVVLTAALGLWAYTRAIRGGLARTRCVLRRPWLAVAYLALAFAAGAIMMVRGLLR